MKDVVEADRIERDLLNALGIPTDRVVLTSIEIDSLGATVNIRRYLSADELKYIHIIKET